MNTNDVRPIVPNGSHPIDVGRYLLATNEINRLRDATVSWIENRAPGAIIYGRPRLGKTRAIKYLEYDLPSVFGPKLPIFHVNCKQYRYPNENTFYGDILKDVGHSLYLSGKAEVKRDRLIKYFIEKGQLQKFITFEVDLFQYFTMMSSIKP